MASVTYTLIKCSRTAARERKAVAIRAAPKPQALACNFTTRAISEPCQDLLLFISANHWVLALEIRLLDAAHDGVTESTAKCISPDAKS